MSQSNEKIQFSKRSEDYSELNNYFQIGLFAAKIVVQNHFGEHVESIKKNIFDGHQDNLNVFCVWITSENKESLVFE